MQEFLDPKNFKSYDELQTKLNRVLGLDGGVQAVSSTIEDMTDSAPAPAQKSTPAPQAEANFADDDEESLSFFKKLAEE